MTKIVFKIVSLALILMGLISFTWAQPNLFPDAQSSNTTLTQQTSGPIPTQQTSVPPVPIAPNVVPQTLSVPPIKAQVPSVTNVVPQTFGAPPTSPQGPTVTSQAPNLPSLTQQTSFDAFQHGMQNNKETNKNKPGSSTTKITVSTFPSLPPDTKSVRRVRRLKSKPFTFVQGQQAMLNSVPSTSAPPSEESTIAFNALLQQNIPLAPQQVVQLRQQMDISQRAAAVPPNIPPKPVSTTLMINLAPGTTPPVIRLAQGYVSSLVFVDATGAPWPIGAFDVGNPKSVNIQWDSSSNILLLQSVTPYSSGNMVIRLVGLPTPITLEIIAGQRRVDYRVDIHVPGIGPNTKELPVESAIPNSANELLLGVLDGIAPAGSKELAVIGADCQAWLLGEKIYLRTRLTVLSPGWVGKMVSPDGMQAYEIPRTSSVLISRYGEPTELRIEGF